MVEYKLFDFVTHGNNDGKLIALEGEKEIPFQIKRVYYIWDTKSHIIRGKHAHKNLQQIIVCMSGSCDFILDNGSERTTIHMSDPSKGLYIKNNIWREFTNFSKDCVIMVLASEHYSVEDYIFDYNEFVSFVNQNK